MVWIIIVIVLGLFIWKIKSKKHVLSDIIPEETFQFPQALDNLHGHDLLVKRIIFLALFYRSKLKYDVQKSTNAASEFIYFLLHIIDRQLFSLYGADKRDEVYDKLSNELIVEFSSALVKEDAPTDVKMPLITSMGVKMLDNLNDRQEIYSKCESVFGDKFPSAGTMIFALAFFIYSALGKTNIRNADDILVRKRKVEMNEVDNLPEIEDILKLMTYMMDIIEKLEINKHLDTADEEDEMSEEELDAEIAKLDNDFGGYDTAEDQEILRKTLHLIFSSERKMPAHFTSNGDRTQSFCVNFELLTADDDYNMASEAFYSINNYVSKETKMTKDQYNAAIRCGEDIMIGAFMITKLGRKDLIEEMKKMVIDDTIETFKDDIKYLKKSFSIKDVAKYFEHCAEFGRMTAEGV